MGGALRVVSHRFQSLQRAENSSMLHQTDRRQLDNVFQCSSASRKFLNWGGVFAVTPFVKCFSALQRAENSSMQAASPSTASARTFQCSSASRKFLNCFLALITLDERGEFQCSSASRKFLNNSRVRHLHTSYTEFQCSSASRKFLNALPRSARSARARVSVLFSEPKIPQF